MATGPIAGSPPFTRGAGGGGKARGHHRVVKRYRRSTPLEVMYRFRDVQII
jgi:hypothetical protein